MRHKPAITLVASTLLLCVSLLPSHPVNAQAELIIPVPPGSGVTFGQVDWPALPQPVMDTGTGIMWVNLQKLRQEVGHESGYLNAVLDGRWAVRNLPVFPPQDYPYPEIGTQFDLGVETGIDVNEIQAVVAFSTDLTLSAEILFSRPFIFYPMQTAPLALGGLPAPVVAPPPPPVNATIPQPVLDHASVQEIQQGHSNVNAARNQCMPMAIANSLQFLENTTDLELAQPHQAGLAPNGNSDGSLVGDIEAETSRAPSVTSRTNAEAVGTWGLNGKLKFLAKNGLGDDIQTRHFGRSGSSPNGDFTTNPITVSDGTNSATSTPSGKTVSIMDLINSLRDGQDCEVVYTYPNGGAHAVELVAAGVTGLFPWTVTASDLKQTDQGDPSDTNLGPGQGFEFSYMTDIDGDGFLEFPDGRELVTAYCEKYVGQPPPPPAATTTTHDVTIVSVDDPAGHGCCVEQPGPQVTITREGNSIRIEGSGDGFPLEGTIDEKGEFVAASNSTVAGFPNVESKIEGRFNEDGSAEATLTVGSNGALPTGQPITYELEFSAPVGQKNGTTAGVGKATAGVPGGILDIASGETFTVPPGDSFEVLGLVNNEGTLVISAGATLINNGLLDNRGMLVVTGMLEGAGMLGNSGEMTNSGAVAMTGPVHLGQRGSVENAGTWTVAPDSLLVNAGDFDNQGQLLVSGHLANRGLLRGNQAITVKPGAQLDNHALLDSPVKNAGRLINVCAGTITGPVTGTPPQAFCGLHAFPSGYQESPVVVSAALGEAEFRLDLETPALEYTITLPDLDLDGTRTPGNAADDVIAVEIRRGEFFQNGNVAFTLMGPNGSEGNLSINAATGVLTGRWDATDASPLTASLVTRLLDGTLYVQIRTQAHPGGELRGQIVADNDADGIANNAEPVLGLLYDRAKSGHGLDLQKAGDNYVVTFYSHGDDASPEWYQLVGKLVNGALQGDWLHYTYDSANSPPQTAQVVGNAELKFGVNEASAACDDGVDRSNAVQLTAFSWTINEESGTWCLEPLVVGLTPAIPDFTGIWFAGQTDTGWGITIFQQGSVLVAVVYFYDGGGNPRWVLGSMQNFSNGDTLDMLEYTGYCRDCPFFRQTMKAGTLTLNFTTPSQSPAGNTATVDLIYHGPEGGVWQRDNVPIQLLSDPAS